MCNGSTSCCSFKSRVVTKCLLWIYLSRISLSVSCRDALIVSIINCGTSIYAGFVIFCVLGFMAVEKGVSVGDVAAGGPGLAFVVYPEALSRMPVPQLWAIFFFIMMATLGFGSQFSIVECVLSALTDEFPQWLRGTRESILFR